MTELNRHKISKLDAQERSEGTAAACGKWAADGFTLIRRIEADLKDGLPQILWPELPVEAAQATWKAAYCERISPSHLNRQLKISGGYAGLPTKELEGMREGNLYIAVKELPIEERTKKTWLDRARDMPLAAFERAVARFKGKTEEIDEWATLRVPRGVYEQVQEAQKKLAGVIGADLGTEAGKIDTWEAWASVVNNTDVGHLVIEVKGE